MCCKLMVISKQLSHFPLRAGSSEVGSECADSHTTEALFHICKGIVLPKIVLFCSSSILFYVIMETYFDRRKKTEIDHFMSYFVHL